VVSAGARRETVLTIALPVVAYPLAARALWPAAEGWARGSARAGRLPRTGLAGVSMIGYCRPVGASLMSSGEPPSARCSHCGATAVGPCARCRRPTCG